MVLLVIFMITTPLISQTSLEVKLPEIANTKPTKNVSRLDITITESGSIYLDKDLIKEKELKEKINKALRNNPNISVFLRADKAAKFKYVVRVLDTLVDIGVKNLNIAAITEQQ